MSVVEEISVLIRAHAALAGPLSFAVTLLACLPGPNLVVPAGPVVTAMGVLAGAGVISWTFGVWAACGAALGMSLSFALGRHFGSRVHNIPLLRSRPAIMMRADALFARSGFAAILIAYFSGPLRATTACIAAISGMPRGKFELANIASALTWTVGAVLAGAAPGSLIEPESGWLPFGMLLVPAATMVISAAVMLLRARVARRQPLQLSGAGAGAPYEER